MSKRSAFITSLLGATLAASFSAGLPARTKASGMARASAPAAAAQPDQPKVIQIVAHKFTFEPSQINLKKGVPVTLQLTSQDVQHGFYIRGLKVDEEIHPGKTTEVTFTPDKAGSFPTICDHFCGLGHKNMNMTVVVEE